MRRDCGPSLFYDRQNTTATADWHRHTLKFYLTSTVICAHVNLANGRLESNRQITSKTNSNKITRNIYSESWTVSGTRHLVVFTKTCFGRTIIMINKYVEYKNIGSRHSVKFGIGALTSLTFRYPQMLHHSWPRFNRNRKDCMEFRLRCFRFYCLSREIMERSEWARRATLCNVLLHTKIYFNIPLISKYVLSMSKNVS